MKKLISLIVITMVLLLASACESGKGSSDALKLPDFEEHNVSINLKEGEAAQYTTICKADSSQKSVGSLTVAAVNHFKGEDALPADGLEKLEGYEWIEVKIETVFDDDNAKEFGVDRSSCVSNYYDLQYFETNLELNITGASKFSVKYNDQEYTECRFIKILDNQGWTKDQKNLVNYTWYFRVPEGYDGMVIAFLNAGTPWEKGQYIYEVLDADSLLFRVK